MNYIDEETLTADGIKLVNYLPDIGIENVREEIYKGLSASPKYIPSKYFYDEKGSELFEEITKLKEYYPTRTEKKLLSTIVNEINLDFSNLSIVELGSGDHSKIRLIFQKLPKEVLASIKYYPVDISQSAIIKASENLANEFPMISVNGIVADFVHHLNIIPKTDKRLFCFFGSTIGNLDKSQIKEFMQLLSKEMLSGDSLILGMDMVKNIEVLKNAYNDSQGVTAEFNKNILSVINNLINTNFNTKDFDHIALFNSKENRIEMHLKAKKDLIVNCSLGYNDIFIQKDETIHTENSHKFNKNDIDNIALWSGLTIDKILTDDNQWFSLVHFKKNQI